MNPILQQIDINKHHQIYTSKTRFIFYQNTHKSVAIKAQKKTYNFQLKRPESRFQNNQNTTQIQNFQHPINNNSKIQVQNIF
jgi:hypothetical protein